MLHSLVLDSQGRKMSKSLGNIVDPMHVIHGCSLDQLKEALSKDSNLSEKGFKSATKETDKNFPNGIQAYGSDALRMSLIVNSGKTNINLGMYICIEQSEYRSIRVMRFIFFCMIRP